VDASGNVYVADTVNSRIQKFSAAGTFLSQWGGRGTGTGLFESPRDVTISPAGNVYVADTGNSRIEEFSARGTFLGAFHVPMAPWDAQFQLDLPQSVAVDAAGDIFTTYYYDAVVEIKPGGTPRFWGGWGVAPGQFKNAAGVALDTAGALYVTDIDPTNLRHNRIEKLASP
jgi:tripartite motif-containing protein 71